ncbi:MAG: iron ABC transporter permease [Clostridiales bacterium]|jgi:iron complex transport system permease protein|nr:iron ABC transporter permease [Clostridiales bacterium]
MTVRNALKTQSAVGGRNTNGRYARKLVIIASLAAASFLSVVVCVGIGTVRFSFGEALKALFVDDGGMARLLVWNLRFPRILTAGLVGVCLSLSGCILQGVMRNNLASPSTIGVTSGASFVGYLTLVAFPALYYLLPIGSIAGAFITTMLIYALAYQKGVSPVKMILSGLAVSALFGALNDIIKTFFSSELGNASGFLVGGLNGVVWKDFSMVAPYALVGIFICFLLPAKMNVLMLGDETANSLGLKTERFRFFLILISSLLSGAAIAVAGLISFVGLVVPHIARLLVGSDYRFLFPTSVFLGFVLVTVCDTIGRVIMPPGEIPVSIILAFIGAPFFLYLLRTRQKD